MSKERVRKIIWSEVLKESLTPAITREIVTGDRVMVGRITLEKGSGVPRHSHESEQLTYVVEGALRFVIGGEVILVSAGEVLVIPSFVEHEATAVERTVELDIFSPIRKDWLDGTDTYFQAGVADRAGQPTE